MGVDKQRANRSRRPTAGAFRVRDRQIRNEQLTHDSGCGISVDSTRIGETLTGNNRLARLF